jgi:hypothetical protein
LQPPRFADRFVSAVGILFMIAVLLGAGLLLARGGFLPG